MVMLRVESLPNVVPATIRLLATLALAAGMAVWGVLLLAPQEVLPPPVWAETPNGRTEMGAVARWFGGGESRVKITVAGLMAADNGFGSALLSLNGAAPRAFKSGDSIADGVTLESVWPTYVLINQDGVLEQVDAIRHPVAPVNGFIPAP